LPQDFVIVAQASSDNPRFE